jgi:probable rRNA maturation factor
VAIEVFVADEQQEHPVDAMRWADLARNTLEAEGIRDEAELSVLFVEEEVIADLNKRFMGKEGPTDVLSFPIDEDESRFTGRSPDEGGRGPGDMGDDGKDDDDVPALLGDVVICPSIAGKNAPNHTGTYEEEIALLLVHGILHLLGMDHEQDDEAEIMEARERELLAEFYYAREDDAEEESK